MNRSESIVKIAQALVKAQSKMGNAVKDSKNPFYRSSYADLNSVREACMPALNAEGISIIQPTTVIEGKLYVETVLLHESGEFVSGLYEVVVAKQNDPQALGSAISYSRRYGLQSMVNVGSTDDDGEAASNRQTQQSSQRVVTESKPVVTQQKPVENVPRVDAVVAQEKVAESRGSFRKNKPTQGSL